jgi:putative transposase
LEEPFSAEQIIGLIMAQEAEMPSVEVCRKHVLRPATFNELKVNYGGLAVSDPQRARAAGTARI